MSGLQAVATLGVVPIDFTLATYHRQKRFDMFILKGSLQRNYILHDLNPTRYCCGLKGSPSPIQMHMLECYPHDGFRRRVFGK